MYVLRQMVEKRLEVQGSMAQGFVDLEKACYTVPREMDFGGDVTVDGSTRSGSEDGWGWGHVWEGNSKSGGGSKSFVGVWGQYWTEAGQRVEPAAIHSSTGPHQQEDGGEIRCNQLHPKTMMTHDVERSSSDDAEL